MTKFCKYVFENTNKSGHHVRNFYVIDKQCFSFVCSQYVDGSNEYVVNISSNIQILNSLDNDYKRINFSSDVELFEDIQRLYTDMYKIKHYEVYVWQIADLKETPKIIIPIENDILRYSPIYKNIILDFVANIREEINKQYDYFKTYSDISDAFKDPIFLSYINVLDEI